MGQVLVTGEETAAALKGLLPADLKGLKPGHIRYSLLLAEDGGIIDDLMVTNVSDDSDEAIYLVVNGATKHADITYIRAHLPETLEIQHLEHRALLALQGPEAADVLEALVPGSTDKLSFMQGTSAEWNGTTMGIGRSGYTGETGSKSRSP